MFIRKTLKKDVTSRKEYFSYQLVESIRTERGPRQIILLNLGSNFDLSDVDRKLLANRIEELLSEASSFLTYPQHIEQLAKQYARQVIRSKAILLDKPKTQPKQDFERIDLQSFEHETPRKIGLENICLETIRLLGLPEKLLDLGFTQRQTEIAIGLIIGRLAGNTSELETYYWLGNVSAVDELLNTKFDKLGLNTVYNVGDLLLKSKDAIEVFLRDKERDLFSLKSTLFLYDLTNTYFEGSAKDVEKAAKGMSKEKRSDCPLVTLGAVLNPQGFLLRTHIFPGNVAEPSTLENMINLLNIDGSNSSIIVMDAGIATEDNLKWLRTHQYSYIVSSRKRGHTLPPELILDIVSNKQGRKIEAASIRDESTNELLLYCKSEALRQSENKWKSGVRERFEAALKQTSDGLLKKNHTKSYRIIAERIGRLKARYSRIAQFYNIDIKPDDNGGTSSISWVFDEEAADKKFDGCYCLRVYGLTLSDTELWETYVMLTKVEDAFRSMKSELGLRPIYHQKGCRVDGHLFLTVLGYHVLHTILWKLEQQGITYRWETIRKLMSSQIRISSSFTNDKGQRIHIRSTTKAENDQEFIYSALCINSKPGLRVKIVL